MTGPFNLSTISERLNPLPDVIICSASFEDRCRSIPIHIDPAIVKRVLVCESDALIATGKANSRHLHNHFGNKTASVFLDLRNPLSLADSLSVALSDLMGPYLHNFVVDTTTFTRESLLILLKLLQIKLGPLDTLQLTYATADEYSVGEAGENKWLSKGIEEIRSVLGYQGDMLPSRKLHLIVLAGFELERAAKLIEAYESAIVSLGFGSGDQSITDEHYKINETFHKRLCSMYSNVDTFNFSLVDPVQTKLDIESQISKRPGYNIVIAPQNNKISTVGAGLAAIDNPEIQICYALANHYNYEHYSSPGSTFYVFDLPQFLGAEPAVTD